MTVRAGKRLPWVACGLSLLLLVAGFAVGRLDMGDSGYLLAIAVPFVTVGALLASHRPASPIGWLFLAFGVVAAIDLAANQYAHRALETDPGSLPGGSVAASIEAHIWHASFAFFVFSFLLFPDGHLLSPRWRWVARAAVLNYVGLAISGPFEASYLHGDFPSARPRFPGSVTAVADVVFGLLLPLNLAMLLAAGFSLVLRLRRSRGDERQQLKWFIYPVAFVMFVFPVSVVLFGDGSYGVLLFPLIPISAGIAIFKYRLYDIDVVINRALVYGALTAALGGVYAGSVLLLQLALSGVTAGSGLAVAASTLTVAALFRPARSRIQKTVDRRFYRRSYDATQTLEGFSAHLREQVDLDAVSAELRTVVQGTMQPSHVSVWLRSP